LPTPSCSINPYRWKDRVWAKNKRKIRKRDGEIESDSHKRQLTSRGLLKREREDKGCGEGRDGPVKRNDGIME